MLTSSDWIATAPWIDDLTLPVASYLAHKDVAVTEDEIALLEGWRRDGFVILPRSVDPLQIDSYLADVEWALRHPDKVDGTIEVKGRQFPMAEATEADLGIEGTKLNSLHAYSRAAIALSLTPMIQRFLYLIFLEPAAVLQSLTFWRGSQQPAHIDYPYVRTQTQVGKLAASWIALEDIQPDAGPLTYYPGSHRTEVSGFFDWGSGSILFEPESERTPHEFGVYLEEQMKRSGIRPVAFNPLKGDAFIWHGNLVHGGSAVDNPLSTRKSYVTHYTAQSAYPPAFRPAQPVEGVNQFSASPGVVWEYPWAAGARKLPSWQGQSNESVHTS